MRLAGSARSATTATFAIVATILVVTLLGMAPSEVVLVVASVLAAVVALASSRPPRRAAASAAAHVADAATPYSPLGAYLEHRYTRTVVLSFEQIESLIGFSLPARALSEREWWTGPDGHTDGHPATWIVAGRTAAPNVLARTVMFTQTP